MRTTLRFDHTRWIHYASPTPQEIEELIEEFDFHELIADDLLDMNVQPKIDQYDNDIFIVLQFPKFNQQTRKYLINEFNAILGKDYIITLSTYEANHIVKIIDEYKQDLAESDIKDEEAYKVSPYYILYTIVDQMYDKTLKAQSYSMKDIVMLEWTITANTIQKLQLDELMKKKSNTTHLKYTFLPQKPILMEIQKACVGFYEGDLDVYFEDLESKLEKILNNSMIMTETLQSITETYDELMTRQMNDTMRILTILTAIPAMLGLIASFYWMNVPLPFMYGELTWLWLLLSMVVVIVLLLFVFRRRKWL